MSLGTTLGGGLSPPIYSAATEVVTTTWTPGDFIPSWSQDGTDVTFPIASLAAHNLTSANADGTTGDARQVMMSLCSRMFEYYNELTTQPTRMDARMRQQTVSQVGTQQGKMPYKFEFTFYTNWPEGTLADE